MSKFSFGGAANGGGGGNFSFGGTANGGGGGTQKASIKSSPTNSNLSSLGGSSGGFSFGAPSSASAPSAPPQPTTSTPTPPSAGFSMNMGGVSQGGDKKQEKKQVSFAAGGGTNNSGGGGGSFSFGGASSTPSVTPSSTPTPTPLGGGGSGFGFSMGSGGGGGGGGFDVTGKGGGGTKEDTGHGESKKKGLEMLTPPDAPVPVDNHGTAHAAPTTVVVPATPQQHAIDPDMQSQTIAEIAGKWTTMLNAQTQVFKESCEEVKQWDDFLLEMHSELNMYSKYTTRQIQELDELNNSLESMHQVHNQISQELKTTLVHVQEKVNEVTRNNKTAADNERNRNYEMADKVNQRVTNLTAQLHGVVKKLNDAQQIRSGTNSSMSQIEHIEQIVDRHLRSLEQIDQKTEEIANSLSTTQSIAGQALQMRMN